MAGLRFTTQQFSSRHVRAGEGDDVEDGDLREDRPLKRVCFSQVTSAYGSCHHSVAEAECDESSPLLLLPEDLLLSILSKAAVGSHCMADVLSLASVSRKMRKLVHHPIVLVPLPRHVVTVPVSLWSTASNRILALASLAGNVDACYHLGMIRFYCYGDLASGIALLTRAASAHHPHALYSLAVLEFNGSARSRFERNPRAGLVLCARAVSLGHCDALFELGHCMLDGLGAPADRDEGRRLLAQAKAWSAQAQGGLVMPTHTEAQACSERQPSLTEGVSHETVAAIFGRAVTAVSSTPAVPAGVDCVLRSTAHGRAEEQGRHSAGNNEEEDQCYSERETAEACLELQDTGKSCALGKGPHSCHGEPVCDGSENMAVVEEEKMREGTVCDRDSESVSHESDQGCAAYAGHHSSPQHSRGGCPSEEGKGRPNSQVEEGSGGAGGQPQHRRTGGSACCRQRESSEERNSGSDTPVTQAHQFLTDWWAASLEAEQRAEEKESQGRRAVRASLQQRGLCSNQLCGRREMRSREFRCCASCREAKYCSRACQARDWRRGHRVACAVLTAYMQHQQQQQLLSQRNGQLNLEEGQLGQQQGPERNQDCVTPSQLNATQWL